MSYEPNCDADCSVEIFMHDSDTDKLAANVMDAYVEFQSRFNRKGPFPMNYFQTFFEVAVRYIESVKNSPMIHRNVASVISDLREILELTSSRTPGRAIADADRLGCMLFSEYDPYFKGHEPPGL